MELSWADFLAKMDEITAHKEGTLNETAGAVVTWWNMTNDEERWQAKLAESQANRAIMEKLQGAQPDPDDGGPSPVIFPFKRGG